MLSTGRGWSLGLSRSTAIAINEAAELASCGQSRALKANELAVRLGAEIGETLDILSSLGRAGLVEADGQQTGAYRLRREADQVSLLEIACAVAEPFRVCELDGEETGDARTPGDQPLAEVFQELNAEVVDLFRERKLSDVLVALA